MMQKLSVITGAPAVSGVPNVQNGPALPVMLVDGYGQPLNMGVSARQLNEPFKNDEDTQLIVNGSVETPIQFKLQPPETEDWAVNEVVIYARTASGTMAANWYGTVAAQLSNGIRLELRDTDDTGFENLMSFSPGGGSVTVDGFLQSAGGAIGMLGDWITMAKEAYTSATFWRVTIDLAAMFGGPIYLTGNESPAKFLSVIIQDDLTIGTGAFVGAVAAASEAYARGWKYLLA